MGRPRLIPPNPVAMPAAISGAMPNGDAQDPPVGTIALAAARDIETGLTEQLGRHRAQRVSIFQIRIEAAINEAIDRCQALGGRRVK